MLICLLGGIGAIVACLLPVVHATQPAPLAPSAPRDTTTISFVGDILLAGNVAKVIKAHGTGYLLTGVSDILKADDLTIGNLECAVAKSGIAQEKKYVFLAKPTALRGLLTGGIDAVTLANNHALDFGQTALLETLDHLRRTGISAAGAGRNRTEAGDYCLLKAGTRTVAFLAASRVLPSTSWHAGSRRPGIASAYDPAYLLKRIAAARTRADIVAVYLHWGVERAVMPDAVQRRLAKQCIKAGADLVIGSHPHVLQGFEYHQGKLIAYSLGNFIFTNQDKTTAILQVTFSKDRKPSAVVIPCRILKYRPAVIADAQARSRVLQALEARSYTVRIAKDGIISAGTTLAVKTSLTPPAPTR
ncbi:MAG: CapA family protein [Armatimonadota bacterium]